MSPRTQDLSKATDSSNLDVLAQVAAEVQTGTRTRYGRISKPPVKYEPVEKVEDDYATDDYDSHESEIASNFEEDEDEDEDDEEDADDDGNLDGFVVADKSESDGSDSEDDGKPAVPIKKRTPVKKRPTAAPRKH
jgi:hypothetical protein